MIETPAIKAADGEWPAMGWVAGFDILQGLGYSLFTIRVVHDISGAFPAPYPLCVDGGFRTLLRYREGTQ
jgi:hypothetical protein